MFGASYLRFLAGMAVGALLWAAPAQAQPTAQAVKAAFLPKFARYVTWPPAAMPAGNAPIVLCVLGQDGLGTLLDRAAQGQSVDQHPVVVRRIANVDGAATCHIVFAGGSRSVAAMLTKLRGRPILTVTDGAGQEAQGMINFVLKDGRVRFFIDDAAAARSNLVIDARLLGIALGVKQRTP